MQVGVLLNAGKLEILNEVFLAQAVRSNLYLGLCTLTTNPALTAQIGSGITEVSGTDYARKVMARGSWFIPGYKFTITSGSAVEGATYTNNTQTFTVSVTISGETTLYANGTGAPGASGTLTKATGTGDATLTFSAASTVVDLVVFAQQTFTAGGAWANVNGWVICISGTATTADAIIAGAFAAGAQRSMAIGDKALVTPAFQLKDTSE